MQQNKWFLGRHRVRLVLIALVAFGLVACGSGEKDRDGKNNGANNQNEDAGSNNGDDDGGTKQDEDGGDSGNADGKKEVVGTISEADVWEGSVYVTGNLTINSAVTIKPCTTVFVAGGAKIDVRGAGSIQSEGSEDCKVTIRSAKETPAAGDWHYIGVYSSSSRDSSFEHTNFLHGGGGGDYGVLYVGNDVKVAVQNTNFESIANTGVLLENNAKLSAFEHVHFEKIGKAPLRMNMELAGMLNAITGTDLEVARIELTGSSVTTNQSWKNLGIPYFMSGRSEIKGATLEIEPGTTVLMGPGALVRVNQSGSLKTKGKEGAKVVFKSAKSTPDAGDWNFIGIYETASQDTSFEHTDFLHGGGGGDYGVLYVQRGAKVDVRNARFESIANTAVLLENNAKLGVFEDVHFENIEGAPIRLDMALVEKLDAITGANLGASRIELIGYKVTADQTWKNLALPYFIGGGDTEIKESTLKIAAGTTILMGPGRVIRVRDSGSLKILGEEGSRVIIESSKPGPGPGDWQHIGFYANASKDSVFNYTTIRHGGNTRYGAVYVQKDAEVEFNHVIFEDNKDCDVDALGTVVANDSPYKKCS